jgi:hypothetical protein
MTENTPDGPAPRREDYPDWNSWLSALEKWAMDSLARTREIMRENEKSMRENAQQLQWLDYMRRIREWITWINAVYPEHPKEGTKALEYISERIRAAISEIGLPNELAEQLQARINQQLVKYQLIEIVSKYFVAGDPGQEVSGRSPGGLREVSYHEMVRIAFTPGTYRPLASKATSALIRARKDAAKRNRDLESCVFLVPRKGRILHQF